VKKYLTSKAEKFKTMLTFSPKLIIYILIFATLLFTPLFAGDYLVHLVTSSFILGILALAYDLLYGHMGIVSLGHSVFYGIAAYTLGMLSVTIFNIKNPIITFVAAMTAGAMLGLLIGYVSTFAKGIYSLLITFAFAHIFYLLVMSNPGGITEGENGITQVRPPPLYIGNFTLNLFKGAGLYYLTFAILIVSCILLKAIIESQLGDVFRGIKENENRLLALGFNVRQYKIFAFVISGIFSGIAGYLMACLENIVTPEMVSWTTGAQTLLIVVLGGPSSLLGPIIGSFLINIVRFYISSLMGGGTWVYVLGGLYILTMLFLPQGLWKYVERVLVSLGIK